MIFKMMCTALCSSQDRAPLSRSKCPPPLSQTSTIGEANGYDAAWNVCYAAALTLLLRALSPAAGDFFWHRNAA